MAKPFMPKTITTKHLPTAGMAAWAQAQADAAYAAYAGPRLGEAALETASDRICAIRGPVPPHRDTEQVEPGMLVHGLVLRSDGHRLHSDRLHEAGVTEGLPLPAGTFYLIDPLDRHWTTVEDGDDGAKAPQLIFTVNVMHPDGRRPAVLARDMWWSVLAASIEAPLAMRAA